MLYTLSARRQAENGEGAVKEPPTRERLDRALSRIPALGGAR